MRVQILQETPMKTLKDRFSYLLPAFPNDRVIENEEEFIGNVLNSYIKQATFLKKQIRNLLNTHGLYKAGMTDQDMAEILCSFIPMAEETDSKSV